jgi:ParB-like chromosome segregation protein Spo0J
MPLSALTPGKVNDVLYRPVDPNDPELQALAESIAANGLREPIVATSDHVILSGHRRYAACKLAGLSEAPCRVLADIHSADPQFVVLLREHNRQRVKTADERVREEVVSANPEESHRLLVEHRRQRSRLDVRTIEIVGEKSRCRISKAKRPMLDAIKRVIEERRTFWPLSDRQIHYALLNDPPLIHASKTDSRYVNDEKSYKAAIELLTRARLQGLIPWAAISDPTRAVITWEVHREVGSFVREGLDDFLKGYYRDLMQSQPNHVEIVGEKLTIESIIKPVAMQFTIPYTIGRGYCSITPRREMAQRFRRSGKERLVLLVVSDFDPEGNDIAHSFARSMRDDFDVGQIEPIKVALTAEQVREMHLPPILKAKKTSSRYKGFAAEHGDDVFELESVRPDRLQTILRNAIDSVIDATMFNAEVEAEKRDAAYLDGVRKQVHEHLKGLRPA